MPYADHTQITPTADSRQLYYYQLHTIRMQISHYAILSSCFDLGSLLNWCSSLSELSRNLNIGAEERKKYNKLLDIEYKIIRLINEHGSKSKNRDVREYSAEDFIKKYKEIQKELNDISVDINHFMFVNKMLVPFDDQDDPFEKWGEEAGADEEK